MAFKLIVHLIKNDVDMHFAFVKNISPDNIPAL